MVSLPYERPLDISPGIRLTYTDAGHMLGSASVVLDIDAAGAKRRLVFSGDIGRWGLPIIRDPKPPKGPADVLIVESTYANKVHESVVEAQGMLAQLRQQGGQARREDLHPGLRHRARAGADLRAAQPGARRRDPQDPDLRGLAARRERHRRLPPAPRGVRPHRAAGARDRRPVPLPDGQVRALGGGVEGAERACAAPPSSSPPRGWRSPGGSSTTCATGSATTATSS